MDVVPIMIASEAAQSRQAAHKHDLRPSFQASGPAKPEATTAPRVMSELINCCLPGEMFQPTAVATCTVSLCSSYGSCNSLRTRVAIAEHLHESNHRLDTTNEAEIDTVSYFSKVRIHPCLRYGSYPPVYSLKRRHGDKHTCKQTFPVRPQGVVVAAVARHNA